MHEEDSSQGKITCRAWSAFPPSLQVALRDEMRLALFSNRFSAIEHSDISAAPRHHRRARARHQRRALPWLIVFP